MLFFLIPLALCIATSIAKNPLGSISTSTGYFSPKLFKEIAKQKEGENSPLSAQIVLSMLTYGASGKTFKQMHRGLHLPEDDDYAHQGFQNLLDKLNAVDNLEFTNKIYPSKDIKLNPEFIELIGESFRSEYGELDVTQSAKAARDVNKWVKEKTRGKIMRIVGKNDTLEPGLILMNSMYLQGFWEKKFEAQSAPEDMFQTMHVSGYFNYGKLPDLEATYIEFPYESMNLKMIIIVPDEVGGLRKVVENLGSFNYSSLAKSVYHQNFKLYLPKIKIMSEIDLTDPLKNLGMSDMFEDTAKFSRIADEPLKVGKILQKSFIEINEEGCEATAVTVIRMVPQSSVVKKKPLRLVVDRPFYIAITDKDTGVTIFNGQVVSPEIQTKVSYKSHDEL